MRTRDLVGRVVVLDLDGLDVTDPDATVRAGLGPDWSALGMFVVAVLNLAVATVVGHRVAGPVAGLIAAGGVVVTWFVVARLVAARVRTRSATLPNGRAGLVPLPAAGPVTMPAAVAFRWQCEVCGVVSIEASTRAEADDLAGTHDRLHHGRPTAAVVPVAGPPRTVVPSTREGQ